MNVARLIFSKLIYGFATLLLAHAAGAAPQDLVIYTYDSMVADGGLGPEIFALFKKQTGISTKLVSSGDAAQMVARIELEHSRGKPIADIALGFDQHLWGDLKKHVSPQSPQQINELESILDPKIRNISKIYPGFVPYDFGILAFMADRKLLEAQKLPVPKSLQELTGPQWKKKILLQDPRTSSPGLTFLSWTSSLYRGDFEKFWKTFRTQWLTLAASWDQAYGMFLKEEAPLVWSYTTSQAYHFANGDTESRYQAIVFKEPHPLQIEGAAILSRAKSNSAAQKFITFLLSKEAQQLVPEKNWMYPARKDIALPTSFQKLPIISNIQDWEKDLSVRSETRPLIEKWRRAIR